jgi:tRNA/rRNA methyltransferase
MKRKVDPDSISIILVRPKYHENVGAVARAMKNMGLNRLILVNGCSPLHMNAYKLASGAEGILERAEEFPTLREAIAEMGCVVGMTSRKGKERKPLLTPKAMVKQIIPLSAKNAIGLVFGPEKEGLTNEELSLCHLHVGIPSSPSFPSLNLAQAVMVICYELLQSSVTVSQPPIQLAEADQLERMFDHMKETLIKIEFLDPFHPQKIMRVLKRLFGRSQLNEREVRILQGIWSQMDWYVKKKKG